jgi:formylglycine-generating enzyme required for sulfatase activity
MISGKKSIIYTILLCIVVCAIAISGCQEMEDKNAPDYTNSIGMEFVLIPAGEFMMGSPQDEDGRTDGEGPIHEVAIRNAYYLGKYEVTQEQWTEVMGNNPSYFEGDDRPVEGVSWNDVQEFVEKLNEREGTDKYRLPSEAEWEYACRAGTTTRSFFGDGDSKLSEYAWYYENSKHQTHPVGQKRQNPWGLYDMHGNVYEWCQDRWHSNYEDAPTDGSAWEDGSSSYRIVRGGSWFGMARCCRSALRLYNPLDYGCSSCGFRLLREM